MIRNGSLQADEDRSPSLRVLFQAREDVFRARGGDTVQIEGTRKHLERHGVTVRFDPSRTCDLAEYDIVHLFNLTRPYETWLQLENARLQRKPVCLSTIYWNMDGLREEEAAASRPCRSVALATLDLTRRVHGLFSERARLACLEDRMRSSPQAARVCQNSIIRSVDVLLPNSHTELELLRHDFPEAAAKPVVIVHNCIDPEVFQDPTLVKRDWGSSRGMPPFLLCAGRVERRKNQARLLRAMAETDIPVVLVGRGRKVSAYVSEVRRSARPKDTLIGELEQDELARLYAGARVHALPSLYDTPGLSSLEAGAMGCNLVMSEIGTQREYFGGRVEYCDPLSERDIKTAVEKAWARPWPNLELAAFIRSNYTWEQAARQTYAAYEMVLNAPRA